MKTTAIFPMRMIQCVYISHSVMSESLQPHRLQPTRLLCPWDSPSKNTGVNYRSLLQRIFPAQGSNPGLLDCRWILYHLSYREVLRMIYTQRKTAATNFVIIKFNLTLPFEVMKVTLLQNTAVWYQYYLILHHSFCNILFRKCM